MPVFLECQRGTACCRWPGQVRLTDREITGIAAHLGVEESDFPNLWIHPASERSCRAMPVRVGEAEYRRLVSQATGRSLRDDFPIPQHAHDQS